MLLHTLYTTVHFTIPSWNFCWENGVFFPEEKPAALGPRYRAELPRPVADISRRFLQGKAFIVCRGIVHVSAPVDNENSVFSCVGMRKKNKVERRRVSTFIYILLPIASFTKWRIPRFWRPGGQPGMSDVSPLSGISGMSVDSTLLFPLLFFCLLLLLFLPRLFSSAYLPTLLTFLFQRILRYFSSRERLFDIALA